MMGQTISDKAWTRESRTQWETACAIDCCDDANTVVRPCACGSHSQEAPARGASQHAHDSNVSLLYECTSHIVDDGAGAAPPNEKPPGPMSAFVVVAVTIPVTVNGGLIEEYPTPSLVTKGERQLIPLASARRLEVSGLRLHRRIAGSCGAVQYEK
jgi:hypothetical protein